MKWSEIIFRPTRIVGLLLGVSLVLLSIFNPLSNHIGHFLPILKSNYIDLALENLGWISIVASLREYFWGIRSSDLKKFIPLVTMFFVIIFVYTIARQLKDAVVIPELGVNGAVTAKIIILFAAYFYQLFYSKITRKIDTSKWIYYATIPIIIYFAIFAFFLMGNKTILPSIETITRWKAAMPLLDRTKIIDLLALWPNVLYYIFAEIYAVTVTIVFFWQIANKYVTKEERPRFYMALMIIGQISALDTGLISKALCKSFSNPVTVSIFINSIILILTGLMYVANTYFFKHAALNESSGVKKTENKETIMSILKRHPIFICAALLTVFYGLSLIFVEQVWKDKVRMLANLNAKSGNIDPKIAYASLNSNFITFQSRISIVCALLISTIINRLPWLLMAIITPIILLLGSIFIFGPFIFPKFIGSIIGNVNFVEISYWGGFIVLALFKAFKYNCFDISKENYVSSKSDEQKREIKNLEGLLGRIGKSGASIISFFICFFTGWNFSSYGMCVTLFCIVTSLGILWVYADLNLNNDLIENQEDKNNKDDKIKK